MGTAKKIHQFILAYFLKRHRIREITKVYKQDFARELKETPLASWPTVKARQDMELAAIQAGKLGIVDRKSWAWPFLPQSLNRLAQPIIKAIPYNLRRMSRTPLPRRAINMIKGAIISQPWEIRPIKDVFNEDKDEQKARIRIAKACFHHPNNVDSFQTWVEMGVEDLLILGSFIAEIQLTVDPERPFKSWIVNCESVRIFPNWTEATPELPHYAQMTGLKGERGAILFYDDEMLYIKDNPSSDNPFGLGKMEVGFMSVNDFLGVQSMSGKAGSDQVHKCFPEWTEVLTKRGWVFWKDTNDSDEFATRSPEGVLQYQRALGFVKEWHEGELIRFHNRSMSMTVTPGHRMYGRCFHSDWKQGGKRVPEPIGFIEADLLFNKATKRPGQRMPRKDGLALADFRIPTRTVWEDGTLTTTEFQLDERSFSWEDWAALTGIWIAEGSCLNRNPNKLAEYRVQIAQSKLANPVKYRKIEKLLKRLGVNYQAKSDRFIFTDKAIWEHFRIFGDSHTKYVPQWVKDAPTDIIQIFFSWAMMGDGAVGPRGKRVYYTVSKCLADDIQEIFQKIGSSAAIHPVVDDNHLIYAVEEMLRSELSIIPDVGRGKDRVPERIEYSGMVYCAMVPNGTLYCRENGYAFWSGNTWLWWEQPQSDAAYQVVRRHIQNELEGQAKISIIGGMKKPDVIEVTPVLEQDLLLNWQEMLIRMVANAFDMSALALGIEHDINRAVGQVLDDKDFRTAVLPMAKRLQEAFTRKILHDKLGWYDLEFSFNNLDDPDAETKLTMCSQLYSVNAITPNQILKKMGMEESESPFADCTQFECMLINAEAMMKMQNQQADQQMQRQQTMMQQQTDMMQQNQQDPYDQQQQGPQGQPQPGQQPGGNKPPQKGMPPSGGSGSGKPPKVQPPVKAPLPLSLPKFPIASGKGYSAKEIAMMPVNQVQDTWKFGGKTRVSKLLTQMDQQEPGILEQMTDELKEFFESELEKEQQEQQTKPIPPKLLNKWKKELKVKVSKNNKRTDDYVQYQQKQGVNTGRPGMSPRIPKKYMTH